MALLRSSVCRGNALVSGGRDALKHPHDRASTRRAFSSHSGRAPADQELRATSSLTYLTVCSRSAVAVEVGKRRYDHSGGERGSEEMVRSRSWVWSLLGATVFGAGALVVGNLSQPPAHTEGRPAQDRARDSVVDNATPPVVKKVTLERTRSLRKYRSCGRDRLLISTSAVRGDRSKMEDTSFVSDCKRFSAVFDGHGGAAVSDYLKKQLYPLISPGLAQLDQQDDSARNDKAMVYKTIHELLQRSINKVDADVLARPDWKYQGSTAVGVMLFDEAIFSFNVGDSRAVMSRGGETIELTHDHKPNDPIERQRVEKLGGTVKWYGYVDAHGEPIEPYGAYRVNGNLALARAIGDRDLRPYVNGEVDIKQFDRDFDKDEFIVIASDGLWDVFTSEEAVTFVHDVLSGELGGRESWRSGGHSDTSVPIFEWSSQYKSDRGMIKAARARRKTQIANYLVQEALFRGTSDNVSVIVVWLK